MPTSFNSSPAPPVRFNTVERVTIGWQHTVTDDGEVVLDLDDAGEPVAQVREVRVRATPREVLLRVGVISPDDFTALEEDPIGGSLRLLEKVVGPVVREVMDDPTVSPSDGDAFVWWLVEQFGLASMLGLDLAAVEPEPEPEVADDDPLDSEPSGED